MWKGGGSNAQRIVETSQKMCDPMELVRLFGGMRHSDYLRIRTREEPVQFSRDD